VLAASTGERAILVFEVEAVVSEEVVSQAVGLCHRVENVHDLFFKFLSS
jgi:hypothetical protein